MTFYIPEFLLGVIDTVLVEIAVIVIFAIVKSRKK